MKLKENPLKTYIVGEEISKLDSRETFFGACDELSSHLMKVRLYVKEKEDIERIVKCLSIAMGEIAKGKTKLSMEELDYLVELEKKTELNNGIVKEFILPGMNEISSTIHIARTVARRCELSYARVYSDYHTSEIIFEYLNKLSLYLYFLACRYE